MSLPSVSIIIVNYNGKKFLGECLSSVYSQAYRPIEVIVVDNASCDGSIEFIKNNFRDVVILPQNDNLGFSAGNNIGIKNSHGRYIATLNNDTKVDKNWLSWLVVAMESQPDIGICASKILFLKQPCLLNSAGIKIDKYSGFTWDIGFGEKEEDYNQAKYVFGACACAALYRREMLDEIGLFDEDFFAYHEDVDLSWRAQLSGWKCKYVPEAICYHHYSATSKVASPLKEYLSNRNKVWLIVKNYPFPEIYYYFLTIFLAISGYFIYSFLTGNIAAVRGKIDALLRIREFLRKRMFVQKRRKVSFSELSRNWESKDLLSLFVCFWKFRKVNLSLKDKR